MTNQHFKAARPGHLIGACWSREGNLTFENENNEAPAVTLGLVSGYRFGSYIMLQGIWLTIFGSTAKCN